MNSALFSKIFFKVSKEEALSTQTIEPIQARIGDSIIVFDPVHLDKPDNAPLFADAFAQLATGIQFDLLVNISPFTVLVSQALALKLRRPWYDASLKFLGPSLLVPDADEKKRIVCIETETRSGWNIELARTILARRYGWTTVAVLTVLMNNCQSGKKIYELNSAAIEVRSLFDTDQVIQILTETPLSIG